MVIDAVNSPVKLMDCIFAVLFLVGEVPPLYVRLNLLSLTELLHPEVEGPQIKVHLQVSSVVPSKLSENQAGVISLQLAGVDAFVSTTQGFVATAGYNPYL